MADPDEDDLIEYVEYVFEHENGIEMTVKADEEDTEDQTRDS